MIKIEHQYLSTIVHTWTFPHSNKLIGRHLSCLVKISVGADPSFISNGWGVWLGVKSAKMCIINIDAAGPENSEVPDTMWQDLIVKELNNKMLYYYFQEVHSFHLTVKLKYKTI